MLALDVILDIELHVVAQVVEAELVVLAVSDIGAIGDLALLIGHAVDDDADRQAEEIVNSPHPFGIAPRQVVVDGDDVHTASRQRVQHRGQSRDQRLALAGFHFGDSSLMQHHAADELHVEVALADSPLGGLAHDGKDRRQDFEHRFFALSRSSIALIFAFHSAILARSWSSLSAEISGSSRLISSTSGRSRLISRSFFEPKIFRATREKAEAILYEQFNHEV